MKITISDIAAKAKVSKMTVSRVLSGKGHVAEETAERIKKIMEDLNFQPNLIARSLSSQKSMTIGIAIPKTAQLFLDNYIAQVISGITDIAQKNDYHIMLIPYSPHSNVYLNIARSNLIDGMILLKSKTDDSNIDVLATYDFPFILVSNKKNHEKVNYVDTENIQGAEHAVKYLYNKGHRKIAFLAGSMDETNSKDRLNGYKSALMELNLEFKEEYVLYCDFDRDKAYQKTGLLLSLQDRPTAIFCSDDYMALGVLARLKENNLKVPEDIAIIGFDDIEVSSVIEPSLTTIKQPMYELGTQAANILLNLINGSLKTPIHKFLKTELIIRNSA